MQLSKLAIRTLFFSSLVALGACSKQEDKKADTSITATTPVSGEASTLTERNAQQRLQQTLQTNLEKAGIKAKVMSIHPTALKSMFWVTLEDFPSFFVSSDGQYVFQGDLLRLEDKKVHSITEDLQAVTNKAEFEKLDPKDLIIYPAKGKTKHVIYVFTDASCPYCHKFHEHMPEINSKGIEVRYIAWPRGEQFFPTMQAVWCSEDRKSALDTAFAGIAVQAEQCENPVMAQYQLGHKIGVNGTPAVYSSEGKYLAGYIEPAELLKKLTEK